MILTFLGTRGEIDARTRRHRMHTSLLVSYRSADVMIDCGLDWLGKLKRLNPSAIVLTHAHPDHAWGLKRGAPCPAYATEKTWQESQHYPITDHHGSKNVRQQKFAASDSKRFQSNIPFFRRQSDIASARGAPAFSTRLISSSFTSGVRRWQVCSFTSAMAQLSHAHSFGDAATH